MDARESCEGSRIESRLFYLGISRLIILESCFGKMGEPLLPTGLGVRVRVRVRVKG